MKLVDVVSLNKRIPMSGLFGDRELSRDIQKHLARLGIMDRQGIDGEFGAVSQLALRQFADLAGFSRAITVIDRSMVSRLLAAAPETLLPVDPGDNLAGVVWKAMEDLRHWLARVPGYVNIVYVEGANPDGSPNGNPRNEFNDLRIVLTVENGKPVIVGKWDATTEPGRYYTETPMNPLGAARIALDQFKAWGVGMHGAASDRHEALVQRGKISVHRDFDKDYQRGTDVVDTGSSFAVNQHWGYDNPPNNIGKASAGCLVGRTREGHRKFMSLLKKDPRYQTSNGYLFVTAVITAADLTPHLT